MVLAFVWTVFAVFGKDFILLWAGEDYLLSNATVAVIVLNFYIATLQKSIECFMGARGEMFYLNRFRSLIEGVVNLTVSIVLVKYTPLGITGVFLGTTACFLAGRVWMDAHTLYKHWFQIPFTRYLISVTDTICGCTLTAHTEPRRCCRKLTEASLPELSFPTASVGTHTNGCVRLTVAA